MIILEAARFQVKFAGLDLVNDDIREIQVCTISMRTHLFFDCSAIIFFSHNRSKVKSAVCA